MKLYYNVYLPVLICGFFPTYFGCLEKYVSVLVSEEHHELFEYFETFFYQNVSVDR